MRRRGIQSFFINKRLPFYLAGIIFLVSQWIKKEPDEYLFFGITSFIHLGIAALLLYMNQLFTIIRQRTNIHPVIYLLLASIVVSPDKLALSLSSLAVYLSIMLLFASFQDTRSQGRIFIIAVLISIASLFFNPILYLFPFFWLGMYRLQCLSLKTFLAGILGILMIALFLFTWAVFNNDLSLFVHLLPDYRALINFNIPDFTALNISDYIISGITIFLFILSIIGGVMSVGSEKIRTSANLSALI
ncbi:hypothetical protein LJC06_03510, partial [Bacteroidales bacterium OttesenSCG-928-I14]|nr:hypothetical protein [Bacteroidales bacterium OttesenSCG-928-I14]